MAFGPFAKEGESDHKCFRGGAAVVMESPSQSMPETESLRSVDWVFLQRGFPFGFDFSIRLHG